MAECNEISIAARIHPDEIEGNSCEEETEGDLSI
jgi:hypothetical protein